MAEPKAAMFTVREMEIIVANRRPSSRAQVQSLQPGTPAPQPEAVVDPFFCVALIPVRFLGRIQFWGHHGDPIVHERFSWCLVWDPVELAEYVWGVQPPMRLDRNQALH